MSYNHEEYIVNNKKVTEGFIYPIFKKSIEYGAVVKFTELDVAEIIVVGGYSKQLGEIIHSWVYHTSTDTWEDVSYDDERNLFYGQMVYCWDDDDTHATKIRFYDSKNKCTFSYNGWRDGPGFDNYEAVPYNQQPERMKEAYKSLKF